MDPATAMDSHPPKIMHACPSTLDRISFLPDNITECILLHLPLRAAARTSILSSAWRNKWRYILEIVFDNEFCQIHSNKREVNTDKLIWLDIFRILSLHCGTITGFKFWIDKLKTGPEVDQLFLFLCGKTIQKFMFHMNGMSVYRFGSHLFSYDNLRKLTLSCCVLRPPPTFRGFHRLALLELYGVIFECADVHQSFISHCPLLEHLTMSSCSCIDTFVIDFPYLKSLCLDSCRFTSFRFKRSPLLATVVILHYLYIEEDSSDCLIRFFYCLPALESIRVSYNFLQYLTTGESQRRLPADIQSLQSLELQDIFFGDGKVVSWVMCLVMSSPNLKHLKIKVCENSSLDGSEELLQSESEESEPEESVSEEPESEELFKYEEVSDYSSEQLRRVEMDDFSGSVPELEFVKFLLTKLTLLEVLVTKYPVDADPTKQVVMLKDLVQLPRVSPKAKIICLDPEK